MSVYCTTLKQTDVLTGKGVKMLLECLELYLSIYAASLHQVSGLKRSRLWLTSSLRLSTTKKTKTKSSSREGGREWKTTSNHSVVIVFSMRYFDRAALFAEACQEFGFLSPEGDKNSILLKSWFSPVTISCSKKDVQKLYHKIFNNYSSSPNGLWVNSPWGRSKIQLVGQKISRQNIFHWLKQDFNPFLPLKTLQIWRALFATTGL